MLNSAAVVIAATVPGLPTSIIGSARMLGKRSAERPYWLLLYLTTLTIGVPLLVYFLPQDVAAAAMAVIMLTLLLAPHVWVRRQLAARLHALAAIVEPTDDDELLM